jgi:hypothetical protein
MWFWVINGTRVFGFTLDLSLYEYVISKEECRLIHIDPHTKIHIQQWTKSGNEPLRLRVDIFFKVFSFWMFQNNTKDIQIVVYFENHNHLGVNTFYCHLCVLVLGMVSCPWFSINL